MIHTTPRHPQETQNPKLNAIKLSPDLLTLIEETRKGVDEEIDSLGNYRKPVIYSKIEKYKNIYAKDKNALKFFDECKIIDGEVLILPNGIAIKLGYPKVIPDNNEVFSRKGAIYMKHGQKLKDLRYEMRKDGWRLPGEIDIDREYSGEKFWDSNSNEIFFARDEYKFIFSSFYKVENDIFGSEKRAKMAIDLLCLKKSAFININGEIKKDTYAIGFWGPINAVQDTFTKAVSCDYAFHFGDPAYVDSGSDLNCGRTPLFIMDTKGVMKHLYEKYKERMKGK